MISLQWQDGVLSLLDQAAYPQQEHWITCSTVEETAQALSSGAILEEKIAAVAGVYGYCLAAMAHQELQQTPQFQEKLDQAKALLLASRPGSRELAAALDFMEHPPEAYTKNVDQLTTLLATAVTYDRQQVIADRNICRNGTDLMGRGPAFSSEPTGEPSTPPLPAGPGHRPPGLEAGCAGAGHPLRGPPLPGRRHAAGPGAVQGKRPLHPHPRPRRRHLPGPPKGPIWCWPTEFWLRKTGI